MSQQTQHIMKKISLGKVILNIGVGKSGEPLEVAKAAIGQIVEGKPNKRNAKKAQRDWGVRIVEFVFHLILPKKRTVP